MPGVNLDRAHRVGDLDVYVFVEAVVAVVGARRNPVDQVNVEALLTRYSTTLRPGCRSRMKGRLISE